MNKARRKEISRAIELMDQVYEILESVVDEEQEAFDNLPESIQGSERGETMEQYIATLEEVLENLSTDELQEIVDS